MHMDTHDRSIAVNVGVTVAKELATAAVSSSQMSLDDAAVWFFNNHGDFVNAVVEAQGAAAIVQAFPGTVAEVTPIQSAPSFTPAGPAPIPGASDGDPKIAALWTQFFNDPSRFWDNRKDKRNPRGPDFKSKNNSDDALWIVGKGNPSWVPAQLAQRGLA
jgi:hypothetical protein